MRWILSRFDRLSWNVQAAIVCVVLVCALLATFSTWATSNAIHAEVQHARTVADMVDGLRALASRHGGFYVRRMYPDDASTVGRFLASYTITESTVDGRRGDASRVEATYFHKNPFLVLGDFSTTVNASAARAKFRMTSDNYMATDNKPELHELQAIKALRDTGTNETWSVRDGQLVYARALKADKSCLNCHGSFARAPEVVRAKYPALPGEQRGRGYGYVEGEVVGITSVLVPHHSTLEMLQAQTTVFWASAATVTAMLALIFLVTVRRLVSQVRHLRDYSATIAKGGDVTKLDDVAFDDDERSSSNEVHQTNHQLKAVSASMTMAMSRLRRSSAGGGAPSRF